MNDLEFKKKYLKYKLKYLRLKQREQSGGGPANSAIKTSILYIHLITTIHPNHLRFKKRILIPILFTHLALEITLKHSLSMKIL